MGIKSKYNTKSYRPYSNKLKAEKYYPNLITQDFDKWRPLEVITSDLTYEKELMVGDTYALLLICLIVK